MATSKRRNKEVGGFDKKDAAFVLAPELYAVWDIVSAGKKKKEKPSRDESRDYEW